MIDTILRKGNGITDVAKALEISAVVADAIRQLNEVPASHLYARVMAHMDHETFERIIKLLIDCGLVARDPSCLLRWVGPKARRA